MAAGPLSITTDGLISTLRLTTIGGGTLAVTAVMLAAAVRVSLTA
jgi:hypothetical protein